MITRGHWRLIFCLFIISSTAAADQGDLDSLIDGVFGSPPSQPKTEVEEIPHQGHGCECVPYYLCKNGTGIITDGTGVIDIRFGEGECQSYMDVCCKPPETVDKPIPPEKKLETKYPCGQRNVDGVGFRITGNFDNEAQFGEFPWMIAVLREEAVDGKEVLNVYQCGGSLIHPSVVLTAAHCVASKSAEELKVRAGEWDTKTGSELIPHQDRDVKAIVIHEHFYSGALYNDVALLFLKEPFSQADNVGVVCLPKQDDLVLNKHCLASGWGKDKFGKEGEYQVILKKVDLPMVERNECEHALKKTRLGHHFKLHHSFVCAGGIPGSDTCKGDGGSPLVCPIPGTDYQYQQVGIVAWGIGCGGETPAVYANVAQFVTWIDYQLEKYEYKSKYHY